MFAHWYTGTLRVPEGRQLKYVHMGYSSRYEQDLLIGVERGVIKEVRVRHNGQADAADAPEGYGVGGFLVSPVGRDP